MNASPPGLSPRPDSGRKPRPPALVAAVVQLSASAVTIAVMLLATRAGLHQATGLGWAIFQGMVAMLLATITGMAWWWLIIHLAFVPLVLLLHGAAVSPGWWLSGFVVLVLLFGGIYRHRVPLFCSSSSATRVLETLIPRTCGFAFVDLGSGLGNVVHHLSRARPDGDYLGIEAAPLPFWISRMRRSVCGGRYRLAWENFWNVDLGAFDVVYAFLSPAVMSRLWEKACREMKPGAVLVSNAFGIAGTLPEKVIRAQGGGVLHVWRM